MHLSHADHGTTPPRVEVPRDYNAAHDLLQRNAARPDKVAYVDAASGQLVREGRAREEKRGQDGDSAHAVEAPDVVRAHDCFLPHQG